MYMSHTQSMEVHGKSTYSNDSHGMVEGNGVKIGFDKVDGSRPVQWPDDAGAKRFHLDLQLDDRNDATKHLSALGVGQPDFQAGPGRWRELLDPDEKSFCVSPSSVASP